MANTAFDPRSATRQNRALGLVLKLACAVLLLGGGAALTHHDACNSSMGMGVACAEPVASDRDASMVRVTAQADGSKALVMPVRLGLLPTPHTLDAVRPTALAAAPADPDAASAPVGSDPSALGLLIAALGVVGFVAHRRSGR